MDWELRPLVGFGPLELGMTRGDVDRLLGRAKKDKQIDAQHVREFRGVTSRNGYEVILSYKEGVLEGGTFPFQDDDLKIYDRLVFKSEPIDIVNEIAARNGGRYRSYLDQYLRFERLGVTLSDFLDVDVSEKWISIETRSRFDEVLVQMGDAYRDVQV